MSAEDGKVPALVPSSEQANEASATVDPTADAVWVLAEPDDEAARKDSVDIATDSKGKQPSENVDEEENVVDYNPFTSVESNVDINIAPTIDVEQSIDDINEALANSLNTADINNQEDDATTKSSSNENTTEADKEEEKEEEEEEETLIEALLSDVLSAVFNLKLGSSEEEEKLQQKREQERQEFLRQQQQQYNQWKAWQEQQRRWQQPNQHLQAAFANFFGLPAQPVYTPRSFRPACNPFVGYMQSQPHSFPTGYPYHNYEQAYSTGCKRRFDAASECSRATRCENAPTTQKAAYVAPDTILCTFGYHIPTNAEASTSKKARNESATSSASTSKQSVLEAVPAAQANVVRNEGTTEEIEAETRSV
ncbi:hypothetical protein BDF19DRAFT_410181 [Syncephalis fuscata]|nr:hypothetical protein BDF19DRAFT_410181 [Syncephalis fuscata]